MGLAKMLLAKTIFNSLTKMLVVKTYHFFVSTNFRTTGNSKKTATHNKF